MHRFQHQIDPQPRETYDNKPQIQPIPSESAQEKKKRNASVVNQFLKAGNMIFLPDSDKTQPSGTALQALWTSRFMQIAIVILLLLYSRGLLSHNVINAHEGLRSGYTLTNTHTDIQRKEIVIVNSND